MPLFDDQEKETAEMELTELQSMIGKMKENITLSSIATMLEGFTQAVNKLEVGICSIHYRTTNNVPDNDN